MDTDAARTIRYRRMAAMGVFVVAFLLRWPSCGESFWVDELHTAWCVFADLSDVGWRAESGNQQNGYFYALNAWYRGVPAAMESFYGVEAMLRLTSVLFTSISAAWLVSMIARVSGSLIGGVTAGLAMCFESNAVFFGTELRPYAAVLFLATAMLSLIARMIEQNAVMVREHGARNDLRSLRSSLIGRGLLHGLVMFAAALHVTSLTVLAPLLLMFAVCDWWMRREDVTARKASMLIHGCAGLLWLVVAVWWFTEHESLWQSRSAWTSFAMVKSWRDVWTLWPWMSLLIMPLVVCFIQCVRNHSSVEAVNRDPAALTLAVLISVVVGATFACFLLSSVGGVALWHRRYLIASLPLLCAALGITIGLLSRRRGVESEGGRGGALLAVVVAAACLLVMIFQQGTLRKLGRGDFRFARRGEDWRSAVALVREVAQPGDVVWVDAGLIEQKGQPTIITDPKLEEYFRYVVGGPYEIGNEVEPVGVGDHAVEAWLKLHALTALPNDASGSVAPAVALLTRQRSPLLQALPTGVADRRFGGVTVLFRQGSL
ncbi:hypothetical protein [Aporhodopirellula aestuarii]|uniref:Glycosyltransferase RgtA/B/C/D-like domain-containing protein n=1 Tax=Aporhodopirellula aestuarii TaxID=2950107 RepID=A0ABT0U866_9BACT|nr:hypothetical protein [Aporhodopirellula aestuarii]MCM2372879.1 hypothetical protein [Aporhodopirellula aestuarii]